MDNIEQILKEVGKYICDNEGAKLHHFKIAWINEQLDKVKTILSEFEYDEEQKEMCGDCYHKHTTCNIMVSNYGYGERKKEVESDSNSDSDSE